jgi:hypothetical protein
MPKESLTSKTSIGSLKSFDRVNNPFAVPRWSMCFIGRNEMSLVTGVLFLVMRLIFCKHQRMPEEF